MTMYMAALLVGVFASRTGAIDIPLLVEALFSFAFLWTSCYVLNDYCDREADRINGLDRPLPRGRATASTYLLSFFLLSAIGLGSLLLLHRVRAALCLLSAWLLGVAYSIPATRIRRLPVLSLLPSAGSFSLVALCGSLLNGKIPGVVAFFSAVMFALILTAGNAKDVEDIEGDRRTGKKTLPMVIGPRRTMRLTVCACATVLALAGGFWLLIPIGFLFLPFYFGGMFLFAFASAPLLRKGDLRAVSVRRVNRLQSLAFAIIFIGYAGGLLTQ